MALSVTNTLTGEQEEIEIADDELLLYVCGLTVSDEPHLGHARLWLHADFLHRWLAYQGYDVRHVENVTDVNEKIAARVGEPGLGETESDVAREFLSGVLTQMRGLNLKRATVYPRVSEHIGEIIDLVQMLVDKGYAYESEGSVYFDVTEFPQYGRLSNQELDELEPQGPEAERAQKRHPQDFALWKAGGISPEDVEEHRHGPVPDDPPQGETWESPWGAGRPGWHVECSAMSMTHLGNTVDIHMGGRDLVFPHHENEIAQSEAATGETFVRYWMHVGMLKQEGEKMSSSVGNFTTVSEALADWGVNVLRMFYAAAAYRTDQTLSRPALNEAAERWDRLETAYSRATEACDSVSASATASDSDLRATVEETIAVFESAMADDLNVREASTSLLTLARAVNRHIDMAEAFDYVGLRRAVEAFEALGGGVLGLQFDTATEGQAVLAEELVELVLEVREEERRAGNYDRADALRADLEALGVEVEDTDEGPKYSL
jgi:cysteinyl-tRNA synthetase